MWLESVVPFFSCGICWATAASWIALLGSVILPARMVDGRVAVSFYLPCPFRFATGWLCPFCGTTRAFVCIGHGHFRQALRLNPASPLVYIACLWFAISGAWVILASGVVYPTLWGQTADVEAKLSSVSWAPIPMAVEIPWLIVTGVLFAHLWYRRIICKILGHKNEQV
ncbi:hypothetical protein Pelo_16720 [Pelomyxa schiedti]|nr:hypothetical protein Pelo_16720 [Pelomyxa schiedti]